MIRSRRIADGTHDQWSQYSSSVPLRLVLGLDGRLRPVEAGEGPLHSTLAVNPVAQDEDEAYAALVAANRARLEELRRARYGVPDFRDHFSGGRGLALVAILAMSMIGERPSRCFSRTCTAQAP